MKKIPSLLMTVCMTFVILTRCTHLSFAQQKKIKELLVPSITYDTLVQPQANVLIASPQVNRYDILVFYDLVDSISAAQQEAYINLLKKGTAMIFLHHALVWFALA